MVGTFVYGVENVIKVRTGEEGYDALQGGKLNHFLTYKERRLACDVQGAFCYKVSPDTR